MRWVCVTGGGSVAVALRYFRTVCVKVALLDLV